MLLFAPLPHGRVPRYTWDNNGQKVHAPGVTEVIKHCQGNQSIQKWTERVGEEYANTTRENAANRGRIVHRANELYLKDRDKYYEYVASLNAEELKYHRHFLPILNSFDPTCLEKRLQAYSARFEPYGGTADAIGRLKVPLKGAKKYNADFATFSDSDILVDWKTFGKLNEPYMLQYFLQLGAYALMYERQEGKQLGGALLAASTPRMLHMFYLSKDQLNYYGMKFEYELLPCFYLDATYNWKSLEKEVGVYWSDEHRRFVYEPHNKFGHKCSISEIMPIDF